MFAAAWGGHGGEVESRASGKRALSAHFGLLGTWCRVIAMPMPVLLQAKKLPPDHPDRAIALSSGLLGAIELPGNRELSCELISSCAGLMAQAKPGIRISRWGCSLADDAVIDRGGHGGREHEKLNSSLLSRIRQRFRVSNKCLWMRNRYVTLRPSIRGPKHS